ncbi:MAG: hypothetical protein ACTSWN_08005 [Promethearchaeota archaeon]
MNKKEFGFEILLMQVKEAIMSFSRKAPRLNLELKRVNKSRYTVYLTFVGKDAVKRGLRIRIKGNFPIDPPSILLVNPDTLQPDSSVWPRNSFGMHLEHFIPPSEMLGFPDGFICIGVTYEYKQYNHRTDWGLSSDKGINHIEAALDLIFSEGKFI